jgi:hypothetical protein
MLNLKRIQLFLLELSPWASLLELLCVKKVDVNTAIWLADLQGKKLVILDNLDWYCDITNLFIRHQQIQIVPWNNPN